jgi:hypothetical protein
MSDNKYAFLALAKQVAIDGLQMYDDGGPGTRTFFSGAEGHLISGDLNGTQTLSLNHIVDGVQNPLLGADTLDFTVKGGHNFNMTIHDYNPLLFVAPPNNGNLTQITDDPTHDFLQIEWDPSSGVSTFGQAAAAETFHMANNNHDLVMNINTPTVHGSITFQGLGDLVPAGHTDFIGVINSINHVSQAV